MQTHGHVKSRLRFAARTSHVVVPNTDDQNVLAQAEASPNVMLFNRSIASAL